MDISVIIPVYNGEKYIDKCFKKLLEQTFKGKYEIIVINDGSKDNSLSIMKDYEKKYNNIKVINQKNQGQAVARNKAVLEARGKYIMFVDMDDFVDCEILDKMYKEAIRIDADIIYCDYYDYYSDTNCVLHENYFTDDEDKNVVLANFAPWGKLYKLSFYKKCNLKFMEGKLFEDIAIVPVIGALANTSRRISEPLYYYNCSNTSSIRKKEYSKKLEDVFDSIIETHNNFNSKNLSIEYKDEIEFIYLDSFLKGSTFRFCDFKEGIKQVKPLRKLIKRIYPNMLKNKYYKKLNFKEKIYILISYFLPPYLIYLMKKVNK